MRSPYRESHIRSILKAVSHRLLGSVVTIFLVFLFTGKWAMALGVGAVEGVAKFLVYFLHERLWDRIPLGRREITPSVIWFTGLSGSGKTTLSEALARRLQQRGLRVEHLDGDTIRSLFPETGFSREEREGHIRRVGHLAGTLEKNGVFVLASFVSPYRESRLFARNQCRNFLEVYLSTPLEVCESRDPKGLYARARRGEIRGFTGLDAPYEVPQAPDLVLDTSVTSVEEAIGKILDRIQSKSFPSRIRFWNEVHAAPR